MITTIVLVIGALVLLTALLSTQSTLRYAAKFLFAGRDVGEGLSPADADSEQEAFFGAMQEALGGSRLVPGNDITLLNDGPETYSAMLEAIHRASNHINLESYTFSNDVAGQKFADALIEKAQEGVQVNVLYDAVGSLGISNEFLQRLRDGDVKAQAFQSVADVRIWRFNQRDHRKILIVDGQVGFIGGINICAEYTADDATQAQSDLAPRDRLWRDIHTRVEGPVVAEMQQLFLRSWLNAGSHTDPSLSYFPALHETGAMRAAIVAADRLDVESRILDSQIGAIQIAKKNVWITQGYFVPHIEYIQALVQAAKRGVDVRVLIPLFTDSKLVVLASHAHYNTLLKSGVKIYHYQPRVLHAKAAVVDGIWSTVGSSNIDVRSLELNNEANIVVVDAAFAARMEQLFQQDQTDSEEVEPQSWTQRGILRRLAERVALLLKFWM